MYLGIEIGGTKLQLGVGAGASAEFVDFVRADIVAENGARAILRQIAKLGRPLVQKYGATRVGFGFGGPVDSAQGRVIKSHQVTGWEDFPLADWCQTELGVPAVVGNDCDAATLAEAFYGAGQGRPNVFFLTVGTGIGGGFVSQGRLHGQGRPAACEIGHLRPGLRAVDADQTVESLASGWGIAAAVQARLEGEVAGGVASWMQREPGENRVQLQRRLADATKADARSIADLLNRCGGQPSQLTARAVAEAAAADNILAQRILAHSLDVLGWAIAQAITLLAPEVIVVGGGVSLMGETQFFAPLRAAVARYVFPPLRDSYTILPAALGESVVVHGALWLAAHG